jgi:hypothetical protein
MPDRIRPIYIGVKNSQLKVIETGLLTYTGQDRVLLQRGPNLSAPKSLKLDYLRMPDRIRPICEYIGVESSQPKVIEAGLITHTGQDKAHLQRGRKQSTQSH